MPEKYISLKEAAKYCPYSQDYLKLRARQGRLKALKMGRNCVTTKEWVDNLKSGPNSVFIRQRSPITRRLLFLLLIFLLFAGFFVLSKLFEPILKNFISDKVIEIERQI